MIPVAIIGAGLAGLACARRLVQAGIAVVPFHNWCGICGRVVAAWDTGPAIADAVLKRP